MGMQQYFLPISMHASFTHSARYAHTGTQGRRTCMRVLALRDKRMPPFVSPDLNDDISAPVPSVGSYRILDISITPVSSRTVRSRISRTVSSKQNSGDPKPRRVLVDRLAQRLSAMSQPFNGGQACVGFESLSHPHMCCSCSSSSSTAPPALSFFSFFLFSFSSL